MTATVEQRLAASPDQLAGALSSDALRLGYVSASPVIGGHQLAVVSVLDHRSSRMGQAPAIPLVPGATQDFTTETDDPITLKGGQQLKGFPTMPNQLVTGLGQWPMQTVPTVVHGAPSVILEPGGWHQHQC